MTVLAIKRDPMKADGLVADKVMPLSDLKVLCGAADIVVSVLPNTPETVGIFTYEVFKAMKTSAIFINVGRGIHVVQDDLIRALREGIIRNAALDVTDPEPLPSTSPFFTDPIVSNKVFLGFHEMDTIEGYQSLIVGMVHDQIVRYSKGEQLANIVDIDAGY
jgi:phosphoglycerate dehydrogenase-like enzyme